MANKSLNAKGHLALILDAWFKSKCRRSFHGAEMEQLMSDADDVLCDKYQLTRQRSRFDQLDERGLATQEGTDGPK